MFYWSHVSESVTLSHLQGKRQDDGAMKTSQERWGEDSWLLAFMSLGFYFTGCQIDLPAGHVM